MPEPGSQADPKQGSYNQYTIDSAGEKLNQDLHRLNYELPSAQVSNLIATMMNARRVYFESKAQALTQASNDKYPRKERIRSALLWVGGALAVFIVLIWYKSLGGFLVWVGVGVDLINVCIPVPILVAVSTLAYLVIKDNQDSARVASIETKATEARSRAQTACDQWLQTAEQVHQERMDEIKRLASAQGE